MKTGHECKSKDADLGTFKTINECSEVCRDTNGCQFFTYGTGRKAGECYWEKSQNKDCPEKWEKDDYNFYELKGKNSINEKY